MAGAALLVVGFICCLGAAPAEAGNAIRSKIPHPWTDKLDTSQLFGGLYKTKNTVDMDGREFGCFKGMDRLISDTTDLCTGGLPNKDKCVALEDGFGERKSQCTIASGKTGSSLNIDGYEFRFRRFKSENDDNVVTCALARTANTYLTGINLEITAFMHHNLFETWAEVASCKVTATEETSTTGKTELAPSDTFYISIKVAEGGPGFMWGVSDYVWYAVIVCFSCCTVVVCLCCYCCRRMCMKAIRDRDAKLQELLEAEELEQQRNGGAPMKRAQSQKLQRALSAKAQLDLRKAVMSLPATNPNAHVAESGWNSTNAKNAAVRRGNTSGPQSGARTPSGVHFVPAGAVQQQQEQATRRQQDEYDQMEDGGEGGAYAEDDYDDGYEEEVPVQQAPVQRAPSGGIPRRTSVGNAAAVATAALKFKQGVSKSSASGTSAPTTPVGGARLPRADASGNPRFPTTAVPTPFTEAVTRDAGGEVRRPVKQGSQNNVRGGRVGGNSPHSASGRLRPGSAAAEYLMMAEGGTRQSEEYYNNRAELGLEE